MEFGGEEDKDSGGWGMELPKETRVCFVAALVSESCTVRRSRICEPVPRHCLLPENTSESEEDVKPQSH